MVNRAAIADYVRRHEGLKRELYLDSEGKWTIGIGHCLDTKPISEQACLQIFNDDCVDVERECRVLTCEFDDLPQQAQLVLFDMVFQLGLEGVRGFKKMLIAIGERDWNKAADECLDSLYHRQTPSRCEENAQMLRSLA